MKLPNPGNSIHNALRSEILNPERKKLLEAKMPTEWADSRSDSAKISDKQFGRSLYRLLPADYYSRWVDRRLQADAWNS